MRFCFSFFLLMLPVCNTYAQNLYSLIPHDTALVIEVDHVEDLASRIADINWGEDEAFSKFYDLLTHDTYPLLSKEQAESLQISANEFLESLHDIKQFVIVVHDFESAEYSVLLRTKSSIADDEKNLLNELKETLPAIFRQYSATTIGDWWCVTNSPGLVSSDIQANKSLGESRKFKAAQVQLSESKIDEAVIRLFIDPGKSPPIFEYAPFFKYADQKSELPMFGLQIQLVDNENEDAPNLAFEGVGTFTLPAAGIGQYIQYHKPIKKFPKLSDDVMTYVAYAYDTHKKLEYDKATFERKYTGQQYDAGSKKHYKTEEAYNALKHSHDEQHSITFMWGPNYQTYCTMYPVRQAAMTELFVSSTIEVLNQLNNRRKIEKVPGEANIWAIAANSENPGVRARDGHHEQSYYWDDQWYMTGTMIGLKKQLESTYRAGPDLSEKLVKSRVRYLSKKFDLVDEPFMVKYQSSNYWMNRARFYQVNRLREKLQHGTPGPAESEKYNKAFYSQDDVIIKIESAKDVAAVAQCQLMRFIVNHIGEQITVCCWKNNTIQIAGAFYPANKSK